MSHQNNEVYLKQIFNPIKIFFQWNIKLLYKSIQFLLKKAWLFGIIIVFGVIGGYFLDKKAGDLIITQEIRLEPNYSSISYVYDFIISINQSLKKENEENFKSIGLRPEWIKNIKSIKIEPVIAIENIFDYLHDKYEDRNFQYTIQDFSEKQLTQDKFTYLYKHHVLKISFQKEKDYNKRITQSILNYMLYNPYFKDQIGLVIKQAKESLENNKKTLQFIDEYLEKVVENLGEKKDKNEIRIVSDGAESMQLTGLLERKDAVINAIEYDETIIHLRNEVFSIMNDSDIVVTQKSLFSKKIFLLPFGLCIAVCLIFIFVFLYKETGNYVKKLT